MPDLAELFRDRRRLGAIVAFAHERGLPVVVDAAHAPHFHFCSGLPMAPRMSAPTT